jgi:membrane protein
VAFAELILLNVDEVLFKVPPACLTRWAIPDMVGRINPKDSANGLSFLLWFPTKRPEGMKRAREQNPFPTVFRRRGRGTDMSRATPTWRKVMAQPGRFTLQALKAFQKNQGLLLSGALAYYILLSVIPLFTFLLLMLSYLVDEAALMATLRRYIGLIIPGNSAAVLEQVRSILEHRDVAGWVVLGAMLFFSSLAFSVLESAMSIIFVHRVRHKPRPLIVSLLLPYLYILMLGVGFLVMTVIASLLQSMSDDRLVLLGRGWSLDRLSVVLLYLAGVVGLILVLTSIYLVMPPRGRISPRHALFGGVAVGLLWEATRHILLWYFSTLSVVGVVYGSLATTIIGLLSLEIASILLLLGAQVIAEYERLQDGDTAASAELKTDVARAEVR